MSGGDVGPEKALVDEDAVRALAGVAGIRIPDEDLAALVMGLRRHLAQMEALGALDLEAYDPVVSFDPRWL